LLVLSRKINQSVMIGDDIEIILLETKGDTAKIGIVAPRDVKVFRQEIYQAIKAENQKSAQAGPAVESASSLLKNVLKQRKPSE
jgi:carbon storage regulator